MNIIPFACAALTFILIMLFVIVSRVPFYPHCFWVLPLGFIFQFWITRKAEKHFKNL